MGLSFLCCKPVSTYSPRRVPFSGWTRRRVSNHRAAPCGPAFIRNRPGRHLPVGAKRSLLEDQLQLEDEPIFWPTVVKVLLAFWPSVVIAARQTTMIRASMTAYSTAVGPSSR